MILVLCTDILFSYGFDKDGILLLEANRLLRAGRYFVWAAQPVYKHEDSLQEQWKGSSPYIFHIKSLKS